MSLQPLGREKKAWLSLEEPSERSWEAGCASPRPARLLAAAGTETGILSEPGRWRSPARDTLPGAGALGAAGIITDSCQLWDHDLQAFKGLEVRGRRSRPGASLPSSSPIVLRFVPPSLPASTSEQQERFNRGQFCFGNDKKAPCRV